MLNSPIEEIKEKLDIIEVLGGYIKLRKAGVNYKAVCPFHSEKTPSFFVSPARQIWHCFGCGAGHSIFDFVMKIEGVEFADALRILAQKAGVELKPIKPELKTKRQRLYEVSELAAKFFEKQLGNSLNGKKAKKYLLERKLSENTIKEWRLGWAPDSWHGLSNFLISQKYNGSEIEQVGLAVKTKQGKYGDRFRGRVMFPVFDFNSNVIGYGGRVLKKTKDTAKYLNTPNTFLYDKGKTLYGLDRARIEIRKKDFCILVEGYVDVIISHQSGIKNVVATSGTALTLNHLNILKRYSNNLFLAFDMDFAGDTATKRGIDLARARGFNLKVVKLPEGKDPDNVISENPEDFKKMVDKALSIVEFYFQDALSRFDKKTPEGKREISKLLLPVIKKVSNRIEQSSWVQRLAKELMVKEEYIEEELKKIQNSKSFKEETVTKEQTSIPQKTRKDLLEESLISLLLKDPKNLELVDKELLTCFSSKSQEALSHFADRKNISPELNSFFAYLGIKADLEKIEEEEIVPEIKFCLKGIKSLDIKNEMDQISLQIKGAEAEKNFEKVKSLTEQFNALSKKINQ